LLRSRACPWGSAWGSQSLSAASPPRSPRPPIPHPPPIRPPQTMPRGCHRERVRCGGHKKLSVRARDKERHGERTQRSQASQNRAPRDGRGNAALGKRLCSAIFRSGKYLAAPPFFAEPLAGLTVLNVLASSVRGPRCRDRWRPCQGMSRTLLARDANHPHHVHAARV
jgi:hypothetical protein